MKSLPIFLLLLFAATSLAAQKACPYYNRLIQTGDSAFAAENYETAMNQYNAAILHCPKNADEAQAKIIAVFRQIDKLKNDAIKAEQNAKMQAEIAEKERQKADSALEQVRIQEAKNKKIIDASYFYADRFGMAVKKDQSTNWKTKYGFINKQGEVMIHYNYSAAQPFDERTGFALVKKWEDRKENLYFLDTFKVEYRMEYAPTDDNSVVALDLREMGYDSIPAKVFEMKQLKVLLLSKNNLQNIPQGMRNLTNLEYLDLSRNYWLDKLENLETLVNLKKLNISGEYEGYGRIEKLEGLENLIKLQNLGIDNHKIARLEGLDNLKLLQNFDISGNQIAKLESLDNLKALQNFDISSNKIEKLENLDSLKALQNFDISSNKIEKLESLDNLKALQNFDIFDNQITKLEGLGNLRNLETFDISGDSREGGGIKKLEGLDNLEMLKNFDISYNQIKKLENLDNLKALQNFDISGNQIIKLEDLDNLKALQNFDIYDNQIKKLENLDNLKALQNFDISSNKIEQLDDLGNLKALQNFDISSNKITKLNGLENLKNLRDFIFDWANIDTLPENPHWANIIELKLYRRHNLPIGFEKLTNLKKLDLSYNNFTVIPFQILSLNKLEELNLVGNQISKLENLDNLRALQNFNISTNEITKLENLENLKALQDFKISENKITKLENLDNLKALQDFNISYNQIAKLENLDNLKALQGFNISHNQIEKLENLDNFKTLQNFNISDNKIEKLENLDNLRILLTFYIYGNKITKLENLDNLKALQKFGISENQITKLEGLENLKDLQLYIEVNQIKEISPFFWESKAINSLDYVAWIKSCAKDSNYALALTIRKGIQNKNLDLDYGWLSWHLIFCHDFEGAIWAGEKYVEKGGKEIAYLSYLAMGYLYNGDYEKAYEIYSKYKNEKDEYGRIGKEIFLEDLTKVAAKEVPPKNPADVEKIKAFLEAE